MSLGMSDRNLYKLRRRLGMGEPGRMVVSPDMPHTAGKSQTGRDAAGLSAAIWVVAILTAASGFVVLGRMRETRAARDAPRQVDTAPSETGASG